LIIDIPKLYKTFRRQEFDSKKNKWNYTILENIVIKDERRNKRLHSNEQAFLLLFINNFIKKSFKVSKLISKEINHSYFEAYKTNSRCVIAVDEATDFHIIDLLVIQSLTDYEISSVTFSGDLMQRLTHDGIKDWQELHLFLPKLQIKELIISYRQSPTLLKIAQSIYNEATGKKAEYISFMDDDALEPKPLFLESVEEENKIEWISKRIIEIYNAYGKTIPSIAVFLSSEDKLDSFSQQLGDTGRLADVGINVYACKEGRVLGDNNTVRVFSVDYIKGLEFEAVFYHNIDEIFIGNNSELVLKNLYVGLSRASFYLGLTSNQSLTEMPFLQDYFSDENQSWK
jgi:DNA helicase IV